MLFFFTYQKKTTQKDRKAEKEGSDWSQDPKVFQSHRSSSVISASPLRVALKRASTSQLLLKYSDILFAEWNRNVKWVMRFECQCLPTPRL